MSNRLVVLSGHAGGGKSTLLRELAGRGRDTVADPARRGDEALSDVRPRPSRVERTASARRAIHGALMDRAAAVARPGWVVFDRGLVDVVVALGHAASWATGAVDAVHRLRYHRRVFFVPPPRTCPCRDGIEGAPSFSEARERYERLHRLYAIAGYERCVLPETDVAARADLVEAYLESTAVHER